MTAGALLVLVGVLVARFCEPAAGLIGFLTCAALEANGLNGKRGFVFYIRASSERGRHELCAVCGEKDNRIARQASRVAVALATRPEARTGTGMKWQRFTGAHP